MRERQVQSLPTLLENFFCQYLITERQLSSCTVASYRDTCRLLLNFLQIQIKRPPVEQRLEDWDAPNILRFLEHLEKQRHCSARSRNLRLAAIHCFMRYVAKRQPQSLALVSRVLAIPNKRFTQPLVGHLTAEQVKAICQAPDPTTFSGQRDRLFFQLLYNTGARVSELVSLNRQDLIENCQTLILHGKGRKKRTIPLWPKTAGQIRQWLEQHPADASTPVFTNRFGKRLTRSGVEKQLAAAVAKAAQSCSALKAQSVSPHVFRHTTAMHLLQAQVDITVIALWLGHESPLTTHKYIEADLEMKKKTLNRLNAPKLATPLYRPKDGLLSFLESFNYAELNTLNKPF